MIDSSSNAVSRRVYNPIYERLVENADDEEHELVGLVAYALYKRSKRQWVEEFRTRRGGKPSDLDLDAYVEYWTPDRLQALRNEAASALAAFGEYVLMTERPRIMKDAISGTFWPNVLSSMLASFFYTLFLIGFAFVLSAAGIDVIGIFERVTKSAG